MMNKKTPKVRFDGFNSEWKYKKLYEAADFFNEKRVPVDSEKRKTGIYPYYGATGIIDYVEDYIFDGEYVLLAEDGANIIIRNRPVAYIAKGKFWVNNHAHIMKSKNGSNSFLYQLLERQNYEKYNSGTAQPKLNSKVVKEINLPFPSTEEQQKIGQFFKQLDDRIALQQRQIELLKESKQGFCRRCFRRMENEYRWFDLMGLVKNGKSVS
ncbi:restriction endonuclease subunit S [Thalassobacillus sp. C254]|uniref:restriction endonuclease subunit S n=1 Tax=Thalassobacillus sp. C254 TaxID=1225341 RepID=UPI0006D25029|nr:restriction endonuclease subunit S [Thalassobacillus sp. C254]